MDDYNQISVISLVHNYFMNYKLTEERNNPKRNTHERETVGLKCRNIHIFWFKWGSAIKFECAPF